MYYKEIKKLPRVLTGANILRMIGVLLACLAFILATSCGTVKKSVNKSENKQDAQSDSSYKTETNITEWADSNIIIPGDTTRAEIDQSDLWGQVIETPNNKIVIGPKKKNGKSDLTVINKPKKVAVKIGKETKIKAKGSVKKEASSEDKSKITEKEREQFEIPWYVWLILVGVIILVLRKFKLI